MKSKMESTIEAVPLAEGRWQLRRPGVKERQAVVGVVRAIGDVFELALLELPLERRYFASVDSAVAAASVHHADEAVPWLASA